MDIKKLFNQAMDKFGEFMVDGQDVAQNDSAIHRSLVDDNFGNLPAKDYPGVAVSNAMELAAANPFFKNKMK